MVVPRQNAVVLKPNVVINLPNEVGGQRTVAMLRRRPNVVLVHQQIADGARVRFRVRPRGNSRATIDGRQHHRLNVRHDRRSNSHRQIAYRDLFLKPNDRQLDRHPRRELSGHGHSLSKRSRTDRRNRA